MGSGRCARGRCLRHGLRLGTRTDESILMRKFARPTEESNPAASGKIGGGIPIEGQRNVLPAALPAGCRLRCSVTSSTCQTRAAAEHGANASKHVWRNAAPNCPGAVDSRGGTICKSGGNRERRGAQVCRRHQGRSPRDRTLLPRLGPIWNHTAARRSGAAHDGHPRQWAARRRWRVRSSPSRRRMTADFHSGTDKSAPNRIPGS